MKNNLRIISIVIVSLMLTLTFSCKKEIPKVLPILTTTAVSSITSTTATSGGSITNDGGATVTARGVCWSLNQNPTTADNKTSDGSGTGSFTSTITGLTPGATYNVRAYAINSVGTAYGNQLVSTTMATLPTISTSAASNITTTTATSGGFISFDGGSSVTSRGVCWSTSQNPTITDNKTSNGMGSSSFISSITGLSPGTTYYIRAYATNSMGTAYGDQVNAITLSMPSITTISVTFITETTATSGGNITSDGGSSITARGVCWSTSQTPTIADNKTLNGTGSSSFVSSLTGLSLGTKYYIRAYATNSIGTAYGNQQTFITLALSSLSYGLLAWYPFNGNSNDESGNGNHATIVGASLIADRFGDINSAYKFSTNNDEIYVPNTTITPQNFSVSLWFKLLTSWNGSTLNLFSICPNNNTEAGGFVIRLDQNDVSYGDNQYRFFTAINRGDVQATSASSRNFVFSELNLWQNLVLTKNGSEIKVFLNNSLIISANISVTIDYSNAYLQIGNKRNLANNTIGERILDEIRVYNKILNASEIEYLSNH